MIEITNEVYLGFKRRDVFYAGSLVDLLPNGVGGIHFETEEALSNLALGVPLGMSMDNIPILGHVDSKVREFKKGRCIKIEGGEGSSFVHMALSIDLSDNGKGTDALYKFLLEPGSFPVRLAMRGICGSLRGRIEECIEGYHANVANYLEAGKLAVA
ncbi:hypothetical protein A3F37_03000 [Candidatus Saccharibacteria bacterium RIFCSPHIGHO2_12_FULL_41_12]|nr:MAG: hypothetical protein A3F37_03000 [Candidatus Saccharibacteria bacterium RIFCSPHIGHO2_12_FULL_41_12]